MNVLRFIILTVFIINSLAALKKKQEHCHMDALWYLGLAILMYIALTMR